MGRNSTPIFRIPGDLKRGEWGTVLPMAGEANWGMEVFKVNNLREEYDGTGVIAGIVDTGVDRTHPDLSNCIAAKDFTGSRVGANDPNGHGSWCTGAVGNPNGAIGVATGCKTVHGKALSDQGSGLGTWIRDAMQWCFDQGAKIISMSLGSSSPDPTILNKMEELANQGAWIIAAAGNSGGNTPDIDWPGRSPFCVSVAALRRDLSVASFSSAGAKIDTSGPGENTWGVRSGGGYQSMSGTSMATPFVAGVLTCYYSGLLKNNIVIPHISEVRKMLQSDSTDTHTPGVDRRTGPGWVTPILLALNLNPNPLPVGD